MIPLDPQEIGGYAVHPYPDPHLAAWSYAYQIPTQDGMRAVAALPDQLRGKVVFLSCTCLEFRIMFRA